MLMKEASTDATSSELSKNPHDSFVTKPLYIKKNGDIEIGCQVFVVFGHDYEQARGGVHKQKGAKRKAMIFQERHKYFLASTDSKVKEICRIVNLT